MTGLEVALENETLQSYRPALVKQVRELVAPPDQ